MIFLINKMVFKKALLEAYTIEIYSFLSYPFFFTGRKNNIFSASNIAYNNVDLTIYNTEGEAELKILDDSGANGGSYVLIIRWC